MKNALGLAITAQNCPPPAETVSYDKFGGSVRALLRKAVCLIGVFIGAVFSLSPLCLCANETVTVTAGEHGGYYVQVTVPNQYYKIEMKKTKDGGELIIHVKSKLDLGKITCRVQPSSGWRWSIKEKVCTPHNISTVDTVYLGLEKTDNLTIKVIADNKVTITMPEAKICESDGSYYFGIPRAHGCADMVDIVTQCVEARDFYGATTCKWSDPTTRYKFTDTENPETKIFTIRETALGNCKYSSNWRGETIECKMGGGTGTTNFTIVAVDVDWARPPNEYNAYQYLIKTNTAVELKFKVYPNNLPNELDCFRVDCDNLYELQSNKGENCGVTADISGGVKGWSFWKKFNANKTYKLSELTKKHLYLICCEPSSEWHKDSIVFTHVPSDAKCELVYTCCALSFITPSGSPEKYKKDKDGNPIMGNGSAEPADRYVLRDKNEEKDSGEGQNEFCFSDKVNPTLAVNFKVGIVPQPEGDDDYREQILNWMFAGNVTTPKETPTGIFTVQKLRSSETGTPMWSDGNSALSKKVAAKNGIFEDKVVYSGYPTDNNGFGKYTVKFELGQTKLSADYEVFFEKDGTHHPECEKCRGCPNWFYYWKFGAVSGLAADDVIYDDSIAADRMMGQYVSARTGSGANVAAAGKIKLSHLVVWRRDYGTSRFVNLINQTENRSLAQKISVGKSEDYCGVVTVAATLAHERRHQKIYDSLLKYREKVAGQRDVSADDDGDGVDTEVETNGIFADGVFAVKTDKNRKDTYGFALIPGFSEYAEYADEEVNARFAEESAEAKVYDIFKDWAKPGCQSKDPFGPRR